MLFKMRRCSTISAIFAIMLCLVFCSCGTTNNHDLTVKIENGFSIEGKTVIEDVVWSSADFIKVYPDVEALYPDSSIIVLGTVKSVVYSDKGGIATTYYDFEIDECWEGSLNARDKITIAHNGGYLRGKIFNAQHGYKLYDDDAIIKECVYNIPLPCVGDKNLLFLTEWENGTYCALNSFMARYFVDNNGGVSRFVPDDEYCRWVIEQGDDPDTINELKSKVSMIQKEYESKPAVTMEDNLAMVMAWYPQVYEDCGNVAEKYEEACQTLLKNIRSTVGRAEESPTVLIMNMLDPCLVAGGDTFQNSMIKEAGGVNAAERYRNKENFSKLTKEEIIALDPDYVVIPKNAAYELTDNEWNRLSAIRNGRIIIIPEECMHQIYPAEVRLGRGDAESFIGTAYLLHRLHSDLYPWDSFKSDTEEYARIVSEFWDSYQYLVEQEIEPYGGDNGE